jgi:hypothetical protein
MPIQPISPDAPLPRPEAITIADVDAAFRRLGVTPDLASMAHLEKTLIGYTHAMKQRAMLPEHLIISIRVAALNATPHLGDKLLSQVIKLCLDHYFPE